MNNNIPRPFLIEMLKEHYNSISKKYDNIKFEFFDCDKDILLHEHNSYEYTKYVGYIDKADNNTIVDINIDYLLVYGTNTKEEELSQLQAIQMLKDNPLNFIDICKNAPMHIKLQKATLKIDIDYNNNKYEIEHYVNDNNLRNNLIVLPLLYLKYLNTIGFNL